MPSQVAVGAAFVARLELSVHVPSMVADIAAQPLDGSPAHSAVLQQARGADHLATHANPPHHACQSDRSPHTLQVTTALRSAALQCESLSAVLVRLARPAIIPHTAAHAAPVPASLHRRVRRVRQGRSNTRDALRFVMCRDRCSSLTGGTRARCPRSCAHQPRRTHWSISTACIHLCDVHVH